MINNENSEKFNPWTVIDNKQRAVRTLPFHLITRIETPNESVYGITTFV